MIYQLLKRILRISLSVFFKKIIVTGKEHIPATGPLIIVANHPNTLMDPILIALLCRQRIGFVGNAGIFSNKIAAKIWAYFQVIPIYRKKDIPPGQKPDNRSAFIKCHEYLEQRGTFLIFPEGSSFYELNLREIKTGTARIALSYEELKDFEGGLQILPIALDYSDSIQFRSMLSVTINPPFSIKAYQESYQQDEPQAVVALTEAIRKELAQHIPQTSGKEQEAFLVHAHRFYTTFHEPEAALHQDPKKSLNLRNQLSKALKYIQENDSALYEETQIKLQSLFALLKSEGLTAGFFTDSFLKKKAIWLCLAYATGLLLLFPIYLFGLYVNYIPYILPVNVFKALKTDIEYKAPVQMIVGLLSFPLFYALELWFFRHYISDDWGHSLLLLLSFPIAGFLAMYFYTEFKRFRRILHFYLFMKAEMKSRLLGLRDDILENMEKAKERLGRVDSDFR